MAEKRKVDYSKYPEDRICKLIANKNENAFNYIYEKHKEELYNFILGKSRSPAVAEDICCIAWVKVWNKIKNFRGGSTIKTWVHRIALNALWDYGRKEKKYLNMEDLIGGVARNGQTTLEMFLSRAACAEYKTSQPPEVYEKMDFDEIFPKIKKALSKLSEDHKETFELSIFEGLEYKEIAEKLKIPIGTVMSRVYYARQHMRKELQLF